MLVIFKGTILRTGNSLLAIKTAEENMSDGGGPFAVIVRKGTILARAGNRVVPGHDPTAHAEVMAIRMAAEAQAPMTSVTAPSTLRANPAPCAWGQFTGQASGG
jgi:tRNA(Arg) A34 adenosine deaminase TadA